MIKTKIKEAILICQSGASRQRYVLILFYKYKYYTLNYSPVKPNTAK